MATLVLSTVGTLVGGPIGGAIGALIGQQADARLFAPKGRQGPRLGDLSVQLSSYGTAIPKLFGRMRVAGTVIWATDLREEASRSGGGKGRPKVTSYSYSASFAVALSARPIRAVHRIWADGKLLRGAAGDWKSETGFRLYPGDEGQAVNPLIAAAEGAEGTPAYRGIAYALFEDMQLADFGNRIPSLTFEVEADEGAVTIGALAEELSGADVAGDTAAALEGYAASGDSVRGAIETLAAAVRLSVSDDGAVLRLRDGAEAAVALAEAEMGADGGPRRAVERRAVAPDEVAIAYYEPARDYQAGLQRARRGGPARRAERIELPAALGAADAKRFAEQRLANGWAGRTTAKVALPWRRLAVRPGAAVTIDDSGAAWRVRGWTLERMVLGLELTRLAAGVAALPASEGRATREPDAPAGTTRIEVLDLPPIEDALPTSPRLWFAACGTASGWRRAALSVSGDGGASWEDIGSTALPAVMGSAVAALPAGDAALLDLGGSVEVELAHDGMWLESRSDDALVGGANLAVLGNELIQFGSAVPVTARRWRLSRLLRGRRGSAAMSHVAGERFVLVEAGRVLAYDPGEAMLGATLSVSAVGIGDTAAVATSVVVAGNALRPPAPVHLRAERLGDGTVRFGWTRRSRAGWAWLDGSDAPVGEESERYRVTVTPDVGAERTVELGSAGFAYSAAMQASDGSGAADALALSVVQLGARAASPPGSASFTL